jgi:glutamine synthetase type III
MSKFKRRVYKEMDYDKFSILKYCNNKNTKIIEDFKNVSNDFNDSIENLIKRNEDKSSIDEFEEIYEVKNTLDTLEVEVKKFQLKLEKLRNLKI